MNLPPHCTHRWARCAALFFTTLPLLGCGDSTAPVSGKVTYKGEPVKGGTLIFSPVARDNPLAGKSAAAEVGVDGTYVLHTNSPSDGAKIGRHHITYTPPAQELTEEQRHDPKYKAPPPRYFGLVPSVDETDVKPGPNTIDLELVSPKHK